MDFKLAAIVTGPDTYLDHLGVLAYIMDMPLFVTEKETYRSALTFYPQVQAIHKEAQDLDVDFLAHHFDALFESGKFFTMELAPFIELLHNKKMRFVYCPHGHSDKGHSAKQFAPQDISLVYGSHMSDLLTSTGAMKSIRSTAATGNYRLAFYEKYRSFYKSLMEGNILDKLDPNKKTALYAPSWQDGENPTSFFGEARRLIQDLKQEFNLILKLHPFLKQFHPAETFTVLERCKEEQGVVFLENFPCIYPLLDACDLYIGDYSSIGYDFLSFDRPLYFLIGENSPRFEIHGCGEIIPDKENISSFIQNTWKENTLGKKEARKALYEYVFAKEKAFDVLKSEILSIMRL